MATTSQIRYKVNARFHGDDIPVYFGSSQDSRILYDATNDEWTVQTKNAAGTLTDRLRLDANTNTPKLVLVATDLEGSDAAGPAIVDEAASGTNPTIIPRKDSTSSGLGASNAGRWNLIANGTQTMEGLNSKVNMDVDLHMQGNFLEFTEMSAPGAGAANTVRVYAVVDGGSLTDLAAVFQDGTVDIFAQEV